jgi:hypothetical protein
VNAAEKEQADEEKRGGEAGKRRGEAGKGHADDEGATDDAYNQALKTQSEASEEHGEIGEI